jgi:ATP-dependent DNA ligase
LLASLGIANGRIRISDYIEAAAERLLKVAREQHFEGVVGKHKNSRYETGKRSEA